MRKINILKLLLYVMMNTVAASTVTFAQVENVPISNPVYDFFLRAETKGLLPRYSLSMIPWQKHKVVSALKLIRENDSLLSRNEIKILNNFEREFGIIASNRAVVIYSETDTVQVLSSKMFSDYEKLFYHYADSVNNVTVLPLASLDMIDNLNASNDLLMGTAGVRFLER